MKQKLLWLLFALILGVAGAPLQAQNAAPPDLAPAPQAARAARLSAELLSRFHYKRLPVDDALSIRVFDLYLKSLDSERIIFVQTDIDRLSVYRDKLDDAVISEDLSGPFAIFNLYQKRAFERFSYARSLLKTGFDFQKVESVQFMRDKEPWAKSEAEVRELWRKRVKNDWLRLRLAGKADGNIVEVLEKRYDNFVKRIGQTNTADAFQTFMNAYTMAIEPHTNYLGPRAAEDMDISMRLSLVGVGASLSNVDEYVTIRELSPGGPAAASGELQVGDRIVGVAQGERGAMTDVLGWRLDNVVALIRGAADTVVVLDIRPAGAGPDAKHKLVTLVRKKISLEAQAAKASVRSVVEGGVTRRIGVISLPSFYEDFAGRHKGLPDYRSAARDVARILDGFRKDKVDAVLMDLRNNGGGSLAEAIELTGMFIDRGPVVQQRNAGGAIAVESDNKPGAAWDGPLGVLINRASASASEIFAAAMQDYGRGVVIGEPSFGKGTVQSVIDLDRIAKSDKQQFGGLKMTIAQFFRINGGTTQLRGVTPDMQLPSTADAESFGESSFDNALPWTQIKPADYTPVGNIKALLPGLIALHEARVKKSRDFQYLKEDIAEARAQRKKNEISLNEAERRRERNAIDARDEARETRKDAGKRTSEEAGRERAVRNGTALRDDGLRADERSLVSDLAATKALKEAKDVLLDEAVNILGDAATVLKNGANLAARNPRP